MNTFGSISSKTHASLKNCNDFGILHINLHKKSMIVFNFSAPTKRKDTINQYTSISNNNYIISFKFISIIKPRLD